MLTDEQIKALRDDTKGRTLTNYCMPGDYVHELCNRVLAAESENKRLFERYENHIKYGVDLARIIESLCDDDEIREPETNARHHYNLAVGAKAKRDALPAALAKEPGE